MKKKFTTLVATAAAVALLAGCSGSPEPAPSGENGSSDSGLNLIREGTLTVGLSPDYPPMEYLDGDDLIGSDVDIITEVANRMGLEIAFEHQKFDQLINSVRTERVDLVISGMSDTVERQETLEFVDYFKAQGRMYTLAADAGDYTEASDVCGASVAVSTKTDYFPQLQRFSEEVCESAGLPAVNIVGTDSGAAARLQLEQGRAQVAVQGSPNLAYFEIEEPGKYVIVLDALNEDFYGISVQKGNMALAEALQETLQAMYDDGTTLDILTEWGVEDALMEPVINGVTE